MRRNKPSFVARLQTKTSPPRSNCLSWGPFGRLESCGLTPLTCCRLFLELRKNSSVRFLSLGDNDLSGTEGKSLQGPSAVSTSSLQELS